MKAINSECWVCALRAWTLRRRRRTTTGQFALAAAAASPGAVPSNHCYLSSLSWTSRIFYFPDSRDLLEVLRGLPWQRESPGRIPQSPGGSPRDPPSLSAKKVSENLKKVPKIWEVEDPGGPR